MLYVIQVFHGIYEDRETDLFWFTGNEDEAIHESARMARYFEAPSYAIGLFPVPVNQTFARATDFYEGYDLFSLGSPALIKLKSLLGEK